MYKKLLLAAVLLAETIALAACSGETESKAPVFPQPENGTGYQLTNYYFTVTDDFAEFKSDMGYSHTFAQTGEDGTEAYIGVLDLPDQHISAQGFCEGMMADCTEMGYTDVEGSALGNDTTDGYQFTASFQKEDVTCISSYTLLCGGDGNLLIVYAEYPENLADAYEAQAKSIAASAQYFGNEPTNGGTAKAEGFSFTYDSTWIATQETADTITLGYRLSENECDFLSGVSMSLKQDGASTVDKSMQETIRYLNQNMIYTNIEFQEDEFFGIPASYAQAQAEMDRHRIVHRWYYFEIDGKLYEAEISFCIDAEEEFMEKFNALVME